MVLVTGMTVGTVFTLFIVPVFYSLIAARHQPSPSHEVTERNELLTEGNGRSLEQTASVG
jgi:multidrug efflux pump